MTKDTALRKSIHVFEGLRRMLSVSENGLTPDKGCTDTFQAIDETLDVLREMMREKQEESKAEIRDWQKEIMVNGVPQRLDLTENAVPDNKEEGTPAEVEGGGSTWWIVCGECHGAIDTNDRYCKHCGRKVKWS